MRAFAAAWNEDAIAQLAVGQLSRGHTVTLLDKLDSREARDWYTAAAGEYEWCRNVLANTIMSQSMLPTGGAPSNFSRQLPSPDSELAQQVAKDSYTFEFLGLTGKVAKHDLEQALIDRIVDTLRELGPGFAFVGRQVHIEVEGDNFYINLRGAPRRGLLTPLESSDLHKVAYR